MTNQTYISGKDAPLEETLEKVRQFLQSISVELEEVSFLNPVAHCWSVHLRDSKRHEFCTNGKGTTQLASLASGAGEFIERLATDFLFTDYYLGNSSEILRQRSFCFFPDEQWFPIENAFSEYRHPENSESEPKLLTPELINFYNEDGELTPTHLVDNNLDMSNRGICTIPFTRIEDSTVCYFPIALLNNLYLSNGMAAGNSPSEARSQALSEILERYVKNIVIKRGLSLPVIPPDDLQRFPKLLSICDDLEKGGYSVSIHDSSLGGKFPVICVLLVNTENGGAYAAFGANCRFEVAIERTLTELLQGRELDQLHNFSLPVHSLDQVADPLNLESHFIDSDGLLAWSMFTDQPDYQYSGWSFEGSTADEEADLIDRISELGFPIYLREYNHCSLYVCRFIVPGMSEVYPVDDLVWSNRNRGSRLREAVLQLKNMGPDGLKATLELIEDLELDDQILLSHVIGVRFDHSCNWNSLRLGELKAHIYLALDDRDNAMSWCNWVVEFGQLEKTRKRIFVAILTLLQLGASDKSTSIYKQSLQRFFSDQDLKLAYDVAANRSSYFGLNFRPSWSEISTKHTRIIELYNRLATLKST